MNNMRGCDPALEHRQLTNNRLKDLRRQCLHIHQVAMVKWALATLILALTIIILTAMADNYFDTSLAYYRQIKMVVLVVVTMAFLIISGKQLSKITSREWIYYLTDEERDKHNNKMNENCMTCHSSNPTPDLSCIYSDEKCVHLIVEASMEPGIIMVGGQVEVFHRTDEDFCVGPNNTLSKMLINCIIERQYFTEKNIVYINSKNLEDNKILIADYISEKTAGKDGDRLLFVIDRFYREGNLETALMLSRMGHTVIALANPSQSPFLYKTVVNAISGTDESKQKQLMIEFFEETNLIVMRDSVSQYRSLDLHPKVTSKLIAKLCEGGVSEAYTYMEDMTTSPQVPPPLRF